MQEEIIEEVERVAIGQMAVALAHSVHHPLASIRTRAEITTALPLPVDSHEMAGDIIFEVEHDDQEIKEFLLFSRPGAVDIERIISFDDLIHETLAGFVPAMEEKAIEFSIRTENIFKLMFIEPALIKQMLNGLITNAIAAMPNGGHLVCTAFNTDDSFIEVTLHDTGVGIPEEMMADIFKPFVAGKLNYLGIGLSQIKRIIEDHSGSIEIFSEVNRGTMIKIRFPAIDPETIADSEIVK